MKKVPKEEAVGTWTNHASDNPNPASNFLHSSITVCYWLLLGSRAVESSRVDYYFRIMYLRLLYYKNLY